MTRNTQRQSQLVHTFGPGSMVDLPTRSVIIAGLEHWTYPAGQLKPVEEPRLVTRLEQLLKERGQLADSATLTLRAPPVIEDGASRIPRGVTAPIFPTWFVCETPEPAGPDANAPRRRRLVAWKDLKATGRRQYEFDDGRKPARTDVTPIRFVCACKRGHIQDIDWRWAVHGTRDCREPMVMEERGTSADPRDTSIVCGCGARLSLQEAFQPGRLGKCRGERPWLLDRDPAGCIEDLRLLVRTAVHTYFPQSLTIISLPSEADELTQLVHDLFSDLANVASESDLAMARRFNPKIGAALGPFADADVWQRLVAIRAGMMSDSRQPPKVAEFDILASGRAEIGVNSPASKLYAQTLPRAAWTAGADDLDLSAIRNVVEVHRLREVSCLYGFTRFEAAPTSADGEIEDIQLAVSGAPISRDADWLPAVEQFGEGVFIHFDEGAIQSWLGEEGTKERQERLLAGHAHWARRFARPPDYYGTPYVLLHSLSHALMAEIALDCGYPASSLKERVYALPSTKGGADYTRCGILIYTASPGAQGTLGGLVATALRFGAILRGALERLRICSNDPVCADHEPDDRSGDRATHGSACHGCLLIAETSCEMRNLFLDRQLLVETMAGGEARFFR